MTAHEFAMHLLEGPDLPVRVPKVHEYSSEAEHYVEPIAVHEVAKHIMVITYCKEANRGLWAKEMMR